MALNDALSPQTTAIAPRLRVLNNGKEMAGVTLAEVTQNSYYQASIFRLEFALSAAPAGWWDVEPPLVVDIQFSLDGQGWTSLLVGEVDHQSVHWATGQVSMDGRDLSARLIEAKTQEAFQNRTSSEVATILAQRHGLTAQVTATSTPIGRYYQVDHVRTTHGQFSRASTEWDMLIFLAQREGYDVFVQGTTLYFQPATAPNADPYVIHWTSPAPLPRLNAVGLQAQRSLTLAKDIEIWIHSWNSRHKHGFTKKFRAAGTKQASGSSSTQRYVFVRPNLTDDQALQFAQQMAAELSKHERVVEIDMPGELKLTPRNMVALQGTSSSFDQSYYVQSITRSISFERGFTQSLHLKNTSPRSMTDIS